jgi:hypothetical protein
LSNNNENTTIAFCQKFWYPNGALLSADHLVLVVLQRELEEIWRDAVGVAATLTAAAQAQDSFWML